MNKSLFFLLISLMPSCMVGYQHTIKLDKTMKNTKGAFEIIIDGRPETSFMLIIGNDQKVSIANERGVEVVVTPKRDLEFVNTITSGVCLRKLTIIDRSKKLQSNSIETKPFRTSASGPSFCGNYTFGLAVDKNRLLFKDKTYIELKQTLDQSRNL